MIQFIKEIAQIYPRCKNLQFFLHYKLNISALQSTKKKENNKRLVKCEINFYTSLSVFMSFVELKCQTSELCKNTSFYVCLFGISILLIAVGQRKQIEDVKLVV